MSVKGIAATSYLTKPSDGPNDTLKLHAIVAISRIGVSPVPIPPLEYPSISGFLSAKKGNWNYEPDFTFGLNAKPWMINNWIHYHFIHRKKFQAAAGVNPFLYFSDATQKKRMTITNKGLLAEIFVRYNISDHWSANLDYRHDRGFNNIILSGNFFCGSISTSQDIFHSAWLRIIGHVIYLNYPGHFDGLFAAEEIAWGVKKFPISVSVQSMQPVVCSTKASFIWNMAIVMSL